MVCRLRQLADRADRRLVLELFARLQKLLNKSQSSAPRGLKSARRVKNKGLSGTAKAVPFQNTIETNFFSSLCSPNIGRIWFCTSSGSLSKGMDSEMLILAGGIEDCGCSRLM